MTGLGNCGYCALAGLVLVEFYWISRSLFLLVFILFLDSLFSFDVVLSDGSRW